MKISIIIPYKADRGYLDAAVRSVECQSFKNFEIIESKSDALAGHNFNEGVKRATGDLVRYLCDDDMLATDSLYHTNRLWSNGWDFAHGNALNFWPDGRQQIHVPAIQVPTLADMLNANQIHGGSVVYHARVFERYQFDPELWTAEEYDFNMSLLSGGCSIGYIPETLYLYRRHAQQKSLGNTNPAYQFKRNEIKRAVKLRYQ